ncbi:MAG: hypothetical protein WD426_10770 [Anditalea sp.]
MKFFYILLIIFIGYQPVMAQSAETQRSSLYFLSGPSGGNVRAFNEMLASKGLSSLRNGYNSFGVNYQNRFNDFVLGLELLHNNGPTSDFREYEIDYRSTRLYFNIGFSFTEADQLFHLIHYMSIGVGSLNFEMLKELGESSFPEFLNEPGHGYILRQNDLHKGTYNLGGFLTEIGFQLGYDLPLPGVEETLELVTKFGYSFSPFENLWNNKGMAFDNIQSGAFLRIGAGISLPDQNYFYRDASLGVHFFYGGHFTQPNQLNGHLQAAGYHQFIKNPKNFGIKIMGENRGKSYGLDIYNVAQNGSAKENYTHTLNSIRIYGNIGRKLFQRRNLELGVLAGIGFGNIRYTLNNLNKPDFPALFEEPDFDGYLKDWGLMSKPELYIAYTMPISSNNIFDLVYSFHTGYELPLTSYNLADVDLKEYMSGPYVHFGVGIRP